jgi:outer membrane biosynthesis protein TonB
MELHLEGENENKKAGMLISIIVHLLLLLLLFVPLFNHNIIPPGQMGILVQFGVVDAGDEESPESMASDQEITQETESSSSEEPKNEPQEEVATTKTAEEKAPEDVVLDPQSDVPSQEEIERQKAAEEARKKAEEEEQKRKQFEERKKKFGDILAGGNSKGNNRGDEGDPSGDPERSALDDIAKGSGKVGGGLTNRGVIYEPTIQENSQQSGTVVVEICVDTEGKVETAKFTQRGSTTTNKSLVDVAIAGAKKYQFTKSEIEKQCGTVTVNFIVK